MRLGTSNQILDGTRTGTPTDPLFDKIGRFLTVGAGLTYHFDGRVVNVVRDGHTLHHFLKSQDFLTTDEFFKRRSTLAGGFLGNTFFFCRGRVIDMNEKHETVQLSFWQWISALLFDGVLSGQHEKG